MSSHVEGRKDTATDAALFSRLTGRTAQLSKEREKQRQVYEEQRNLIEQDTVKISMANQKRFEAADDSVEAILKRETIGLVTLEDFQKRRLDLEREKQLEAAAGKVSKNVEGGTEGPGGQSSQKKKKKRKDTKASKLSFSFGDDEEEELDIMPSKKSKKLLRNSEVNTTYLPNRDREEAEKLAREELRQKWEEDQVKMKEQKLVVTFSYWDGSGHRRSAKTTKGSTIGQFLQKAQRKFKELIRIPVDQLMFVKEDVILPHHVSFYDLIVTGARGKSGPLYHFDVHDDVRVLADATKEKDESHAAKVVDRHWYEKNRHIFPASRWEHYDPDKKYDKYTVHGGEVNEDEK